MQQIGADVAAQRRQTKIADLQVAIGIEQQLTRREEQKTTATVRQLSVPSLGALSERAETIACYVLCLSHSQV